MIDNWVHNFPASKDEHPEYIDWPNEGWDLILVNVIHEIFTALDAMQEALGYDIRGGHATCKAWLDVIEAAAGVGGFTDRGDPADADYTHGDLTHDGAFHDLDLSSIVPAGAKSVLLHVLIEDSNSNHEFVLRENGNTNTANVSKIRTQVGGVALAADCVVALDTNRVIEYRSLLDSAANITVRGWWK